MKTKDILRNIARMTGVSALLLSAAAFTACNDDETSTGSPYLRLENAVVSSKLVSSSSELGFNVGAMVGDYTTELIRYDIRSNCDWTISCASDGADEWLQIHPTEGSGDGIVRFCVTDNDHTAPRATTVVFRYANGRQTEVTLAVTQSANIPHINIYVDNSLKEQNAISNGRYAKTYAIRVDANVDYFYSFPKTDWATLTEVGDNQFTLELAAYPDQPTTLERSNILNFKGVGEFANITSKLDVLQTIAPTITAAGEDLDASNSLPPFDPTTPAPVKITVKSNWGWSVSKENAADNWYTVSPESGEADKEYVVTITPTKNTSAERSSTFSFVTEEVLGQRGEFAVSLTQEAGNGGGSSEPMTGLDAPVKWFFNGASGTDYSVPTEQFETNNKLMAVSGVGYLSYTHTYVDSTGAPDPDCKRTLGGTGQPYVSGAWPGDYWLFEVPVKNFKANTKVKFTAISRVSGSGQKYWRMEYLDGGTWKAVSELLQTGTFNGAEFTYTHALPTANTEVTATATFKRAIADGSVQFRFVCAANCTAGNAALENPNGGTMRWASSSETGFNDSPIIEVVE